MSTLEPPGGPTPSSADSNPTPGRRMAPAIVAALLAGLASWGIVEATLRAYTPVFLSMSRPYPTAEDIARITQARIESGTLDFAATGALVGLALGLAGGLSRGSTRSAALAGMIGLLVGGLVEGGAAFGALSYIYKSMDLQADDLLQTLLSHEALWVGVGLAGGLAYGIGRGGRATWVRAALGGLLGAAVATVAYEFLGALAFPTQGIQQPYADSPVPRALAQVLMTLGGALGATAAVAKETSPAFIKANSGR